ncbi:MULTISPECIES: membrane protein insertase YidC [Aerococcus]|nr:MULTISPECIES: membrane protein insertase YidC [Aerococcus]MDK6369334.1 membrane protein insertase YidC [Aerococcus sp. UMB9870]MDK6679159.1 membrane protein insertase YidC [Aerococcus sp. UMB8608]MDK6687156.1 membrane protein insertase YidC [Aerococcus sp. UMB8623]MDK6941112.1 membrane protein insertase YidC [Aerococcus sp. UMB8487]
MKSKFWTKKKLSLSLVLMALPLFLGACATAREPITAESTGFWDRYIVYSFSRLIIWLSDLFGGNYGLGIIVFTLIIRLILVPLYHYQIKSTEKMQVVQPEMQALREKYASKDPATQQKLEEEMAKLNEKYDYNPLSGCLPMLIQLPILMGLYQAISRTEVLSNGHFLWMELGQPDPYFILPVLAAALTWYNTRLMSIGNPQNNQSMAAMQWLMPAMILFMGATLPSAIALYWVASNAFTIGQTLILNNPYKKREARLEQEKAERDLEKRLEKAKRHPRTTKKKR